MTPIDQVKPTLPGNWPRRVENRNKRDGGGKPPRAPKDQNSPGKDPGEWPDGREHVVDELA
ncbi:MAG: hypothetical protein QY320_05705 [Gammaproteobacteria bacterium]|nr:MAG: hypothetical protein QY320_05705 [Gammaproteobacteria bacterium]